MRCNIWRCSSSSRQRGSGGAMAFIEVEASSDFPLQNLPYGVFSTKEKVGADW